MTKNILKDVYVIKIKRIIFKYIKELDFNFFIFGSRVDWTYTDRSDYDIWYTSPTWEQLNSIILSDIEDEFDNIPILIDLINFDRVTDDFKKIAMKNVIWLNKVKKQVY